MRNGFQNQNWLADAPHPAYDLFDTEDIHERVESEKVIFLFEFQAMHAVFLFAANPHLAYRVKMPGPFEATSRRAIDLHIIELER